jgi:hypothetical protein
MLRDLLGGLVKIFLSYGHDRNTPIVLRIKDDLERAGHAVWIDKSQIKGGDDWRRSIIDGLMDSDWTLGFLSSHSVRNPGVCLDELAIALHVRGGTIATVLVEAEAAVETPVSVSSKQWIDMHDWNERMAPNSDGGDSWYRSKLNEILCMLADPKTRGFEGEIKKLSRLLRPMSQEAEIASLVDGFAGREWLRSALDDWRKNAHDSRLFWISGAPGTGKSAFAAWLAHKGRLDVIGVNFCRYNFKERSDPAHVLRTLAFQIASRLPDFRRLLLHRFQEEDRDGRELERRNVSELFEWLLVEPLRLTIDGGRQRERSLIIIDALDETTRDNQSALAEVLAESCNKLPDWLGVVVTGRPEPSILRQFAGFKPHVIDTESAENLDDLRAYVRRWLAIESLGGGETDVRIERIVAASRGNFLFLRMLQAAVTAGLMDLAHPEGLPQGLIGLYERWFRRQFRNLSEFEACRPLLEVSVAAEHPVPEKWLEGMLGWSKRDKARILGKVGSFIERRSNCVLLFHKSLRDWLVDDQSSGADFFIDPSAGSTRLVTALWPSFVRWAEDSGNTLDLLVLAELLSQLTGSKTEPTRLQEFARLLSSPEVIRRRMLIGTDADEDTRRQARHEFAHVVTQSLSAWPRGVNPALMVRSAPALAEIAWECLKDPSGIHPEESILLLLTAVRIATPEVVQDVMDQRLRNLIVRYNFSRGFDDYMGIAGPKGTENMSHLENEVAQTLSAYENRPHLATWAKEWDEIFRDGYKPPWASN